jgi:hypothetical protein
MIHELRQSMQHGTATEHLIGQSKPHRTIERATEQPDQ